MKVAVVGGGVGGLCVAVRLGAAGHDVTVFERNPVVGGKLARTVENGYTFDVGPSLFTLPGLFDEVFRSAGSSLAAEVDLVRLDPQIVHRWPDGSLLAVPDPAVASGPADPSVTAAAVEAFSPGEGRNWRRFARRSASTWEVAERTFLAGPVVSPWSLVRRGRSPLDLLRVDGVRSLDRAARRTFGDPRLRQLVDRYATYSGSSPMRAPATLACIAHVEQAFGCFHVVGGLGRLAVALERAALAVGVRIRTSSDVGRIVTSGGSVVGVELADGGRHLADVVVSDVDALHLHTDLLAGTPMPRRVSRARRSTSVFSVCAAVRGRTDGVAHHQVFHGSDHRREYRELSSGRIPTDPTVHACVASVTDPSMAPADGENWVLTVNVPANVGIDRAMATAMVLNRLAERGVDLRQRISFTRTLVPADIDARYRAPGGAIYGTSSDGRSAAFVRPGNVGPVDGLFLVGGSAHPGGGLPLVATGARIVAELVADRER